MIPTRPEPHADLADWLAKDADRIAMLGPDWAGGPMGCTLSHVRCQAPVVALAADPPAGLAEASDGYGYVVHLGNVASVPDLIAAALERWHRLHPTADQQ